MPAVPIHNCLAQESVVRALRRSGNREDRAVNMLLEVKARMVY